MYERLLISNIAMLHLIKSLSDNVAENTNKLSRKNRWRRIGIAYLNKYLEFETQFKDLILNKNGEIKNYHNLFKSEVIYKLLRKMDEIHDLLDAESETSLINGYTISKSLMLRIHYDIVYSPEMKYLCRINIPQIIIEGPDRSGKSTLISQLHKFFVDSRKLLLNITTQLQHVTEGDKVKNKFFLDLSTQEDRLLFQNNLFNRVSRNIYNRNRFPIYYEQIMLMDRSLLSNLIYSYVMLDQEHFRKYLFSNYRSMTNSNPYEKINQKEREKKIEFTFVEPNRIEFIHDNDNIASSNYPKSAYKTNNPFYNEDDLLDINNIFNDGIASSYTFNHSAKTSSIISSLYKRMREYTLNVLYIKNTVYSFNKLDEIEKNVKQDKIIELFSLFKGIKNLDELRRSIMPSDKYINSYKTIEKNDFTYSYNITNLMVQNVKASFDLDTHYHYDVSIIYDDNKERSAIETFDKCIEKLIEINEKIYSNEIRNIEPGESIIDDTYCDEGLPEMIEPA